MNNKNLTGGELGDAPNNQYSKFFAKFSEIENLDVMQWKPVHILGYFCKKYKETYQTDYKFKFNSPSPSKCFEVFQIKKLSSLLTARPNLLRDYIDWIYQTKVVQAKRKLTSISFMTHEGLINEYKFNVLLAEKKETTIDRSTILPDKYKQVFDTCQVNVSTYGDLAFLAQMSPMPDSLFTALNQLDHLGFDRSVLGKIV